MKVLFTSSQRGKKYYGKFYDQILSQISELGFKLIKDDIQSTSPEDFYKSIEENHKQNVILYKQKIQSIQDADICVYEASIHSLSVGFVIQKSLEFNKPTIVLFYRDHTPFFLTGVENEKLIIRNYDEKNIQLVVKNALKEAQHFREKRFNFFISPSLLGYLEETSKELGITKSTFIRNLIIAHMKKSRK